MFPRYEEHADAPDLDRIFHSRRLLNRQSESYSALLPPLDEPKDFSVGGITGYLEAAGYSSPSHQEQSFSKHQKHTGPGRFPYSGAETLPCHLPRRGLNTTLNQTEGPSTLFARYVKPKVEDEPAAGASFTKYVEDVGEFGHGPGFTTFVKESGNALERSQLHAEVEQYKSQTNQPSLDARSDPHSTINRPSSRPSKFDPSIYTDPFCKFLTENPTVFHFVDAIGKELASKGFKELSERDTWKLERGAKYYVKRNGSALIGFVVGENYEPGNGVAMSACHVDSIATKRESFIVCRDHKILTLL
jgi:Aminopeptidase I zinc metalloprotease (M18)